MRRVLRGEAGGVFCKRSPPFPQTPLPNPLYGAGEGGNKVPDFPGQFVGAHLRVRPIRADT
jgi:hypothetical protein